MSKKEQYEQRTAALLAPIISENSLRLWDVEFVKEGPNNYLRVYIDKDGGVDIDDCETVSRALEAELDKEDFIDGTYTLEVCSPGLTRPLKTENDFKNSIGRDVEVHFYKETFGSKEIRGVLKSGGRDEVTIEIEDGSQLAIKRKDISLIRLAFDF